MSSFPELYFNVDNGYLEGLVRGFKAGVLRQGDYVNLVQCESLEVTAVTSEIHYTNRTLVQHLVRWFKGEAKNPSESKRNKAENSFTDCRSRRTTEEKQQEKSTDGLPSSDTCQEIQTPSSSNEGQDPNKG